MLAKDITGRSVQVLHPLDGGCQTIAPTATNSDRNATAFKAETVAVGVRVRSGEKVRVKLGDVTVTPGASDYALTSDDGWIYLSLEGLDAAGVAKPKATHLGVLAGATLTASVDVQEFN